MGGYHEASHKKLIEGIKQTQRCVSERQGWRRESQPALEQTSERLEGNHSLCRRYPRKPTALSLVCVGERVSVGVGER